MKSNKPNHLIPQQKNLSTSSVSQFSNPYNFSKNHPQTVTPNMTRSPPTASNTGSNIYKLNTDQTKNRFNQTDLPKHKNLQNMNLGGASRSSTKSIQKEQKKDFVSMQQALGFLNFINMNPIDAFKLATIPLQQIQIHSQNISREVDRQKSRQLKKKPSTLIQIEQQKNQVTSKQQQSKDSGTTGKQQDDLDQEDSEEGSLTQNNKKLNKNRAIKRIIQTAYELLQKNYHFTSDQSQLSEEQRSTSTQFNIYLKQYNRIIEQINSKEYEEIQTSNLLYDKNQEELQEIFQYTVIDDFRERLFALFTKDKLGKDNVDLMIKAFREVLVSLRLNQLKVEYFDSQQPPKIIKMSEIQNVEYYTHPYIFIALTINKDKTKSKQQLYLKFSSEQNQDKWDRALYCCFMSRKMSKKQKLFEIEFPVEDVMKKEKQQYKKEDENYELNDDNRLIDKLFREKQVGRSPTSNSIAYTIQNNQGQINMLSDRPDYMNLVKNRTEDRIPIDNQDVRRINTSMTGGKNDTPFRNLEMNTNLKQNQRKTDPLDNSPRQPQQNTTPINRAQTIFNKEPLEEQPNNLSKKSTFNVNNQPNSNTQIPPRSNTLPHNPENKPPPTDTSTNPFMKLLRIAQEQPERKYLQQKPRVHEKIEQNEEMQKRRQEELLQQKLGNLKKIREIEKNNVRGVVCQKEKFFMNKEKIVFFHDETMLNSSRQIANQKGIQKQNLQSLKNLTSKQIQSNKFIQYWDYDYKKDQKQQRKIISVSQIIDYKLIPSTLGQTTTSLLIEYNCQLSDNKVDKKELRLIFANPISNGFTSRANITNYISKAQELYEWIRLIKSV